jgi:dipeptidyl aminopeptidase/acylaminoacyl peptidase
VVVLLAFGASLAFLWRQAEGARADVEIAREKLARAEYGLTMQVAHQEWRDNNPTASLALLNSTRADLRGWEWNRVQSLWHSEVLELKGHTEDIASVSWSPDGTRLATASGERTARVWDSRNRAELRAAGW